MKKRQILIILIIIAAATDFTGLSRTDSPPDVPDLPTGPEDTVFDGFKFSSAKLFVDTLNSHLRSAGISFGSPVLNEDEIRQAELGYHPYFESDSSAQILLALGRTFPGTQIFTLTYNTSKNAENAKANFCAAVYAVSIMLEDSDIAAVKMKVTEFEKATGNFIASYKSAVYEYELIFIKEEYVLTVTPISNKDKK